MVLLNQKDNKNFSVDVVLQYNSLEKFNNIRSKLERNRQIKDIEFLNVSNEFAALKVVFNENYDKFFRSLKQSELIVKLSNNVLILSEKNNEL